MTWLLLKNKEENNPICNWAIGKTMELFLGSD